MRLIGHYGNGTEYPFIGWNTVYGRNDEHATPYLSRYWIGRLRLHIFHRGDQDPDMHNHPWDFWTFPLVSYEEEVAEDTFASNLSASGAIMPIYQKRQQCVRAFRLHYRPAGHTHRVLHSTWLRPTRRSGLIHWKYTPPECRAQWTRNIVTIVWTGPKKQSWGFLKNRAGQWCWTPWKDYVFGGGKDAPCSV